MSRTRTALAASAILVTALAGSAAAAVSSSVAASLAPARTAGGGAATISLRQTSIGKVLVNGRGFTVYAFSRDRRRTDRCAAISGCLQVWPAVRTSGRPRAGHGVKPSLLGTIRIPGGTIQVTYAGHPLYLYSGDSTPGSTSYVGVSAFHGIWRAVKPSGAVAG